VYVWCVCVCVKGGGGLEACLFVPQQNVN